MILVEAVATIGGLIFILAVVLVIADRWLKVVEDPRVQAVRNMLPGTNCGACGHPGCRPFAEALVGGEARPVQCTVSTPEQRKRIAAYLGIEEGVAERRVARLACAGGNNVAHNRAHYRGQQTCAAAALVAGGGKACFWGCIGLADCQRVCDFDAIHMNRHQLPVVDELACTACGDCVEACPKDLFSLQPVHHRLWVACSALGRGDELLEDCEVACTGCERCAADAPGQIAMRSGLPVIDPNDPPLTAAPTQRCPTGAIVWIDPDRGPVKGAAARKIIRQGPQLESPS